MVRFLVVAVSLASLPAMLGAQSRGGGMAAHPVAAPAPRIAVHAPAPAAAAHAVAGTVMRGGVAGHYVRTRSGSIVFRPTTTTHSPVGIGHAGGTRRVVSEDVPGLG